MTEVGRVVSGVMASVEMMTRSPALFLGLAAVAMVGPVGLVALLHQLRLSPARLLRRLSRRR